MSKSCKHFLEVNGVKVRTLTWTEDMACWSFSLPAGFACPMAHYGDNTICGSCYAQINRYNMPNVLRAQFVRFEFLKQHLRTEEGYQHVVNTFVNTISTHVDNGYFRWFDSGDLFSPKMVLACHAICSALPDIKFWFPTRSWPHSRALPKVWVDNLTLLAALPNVVVRPSALNFDDPAPQVDFLSVGSTAHTESGQQAEGHLECPKTINGGSCETNRCRECWESNNRISYLVHGTMGRHKPANSQSERIVGTRHRIRDEVLAELTIGRT